MGPIRGSKSRKKVEHPLPPAAAATATSVVFSSPLPQPQSLDWWNDFSKRFRGTLSERRDSCKFESIFNISMKTFYYICSLVKEEMMAKRSNFTDLNGKPLCLYDQVAIALRRLSSGESLSSVGDSFNLNQTTVAQITKRFVEALEQRGLCHLHWPSTEAQLEEVKRKFENIGCLPNCCGAIDTTHILMCLSAADRSTKVWCDRENKDTMTLQAIVDPDLRFSDIVAGWPGSLSDSIIHQSSNFFKLCKEGKRLSGKKRKLSEGFEVREYIVGNSGFPLLPWLLTPYRGKKLCDSEVHFNKMHFKTRMVAQRALAKLKQNWKIIQGTMWRPDKNRLPRIILACCILHNILIDMEDEVQQEMAFSHRHDLDYRPMVCDSDKDQEASVLREKLSLYLSGKLAPYNSYSLAK